MTPLIGTTTFFYDMQHLHFLTPFDTPCYQHVYTRHTDKTDGEVESSVHWPWKHVSFTTDKATIRLQIPMLGRQKPTTPTRSVRYIEDRCVTSATRLPFFFLPQNVCLLNIYVASRQHCCLPNNKPLNEHKTIQERFWKQRFERASIKR